MKTAAVLILVGLLGTGKLVIAQNGVTPDDQSRKSPPAAARFSASTEGVITDSKTGLQWIVGPDKGLTYAEAESWVKECKTAGDGWRIPTGDELLGLRLEGDKRNGYELDPLFKDKVSPSKKIEGIGISFLIVWNAREPNKADYTNFPWSHALMAGREYAGADGRVFAVRAAQK